MGVFPAGRGIIPARALESNRALLAFLDLRPPVRCGMVDEDRVREARKEMEDVTPHSAGNVQDREPTLRVVSRGRGTGAPTFRGECATRETATVAG
jgi:hypothetical protein